MSGGRANVVKRGLDYYTENPWNGEGDDHHNADIHFRGVSNPVGIGPLKAAREGYAGGKKGITGFPTFPRGGIPGERSKASEESQSGEVEKLGAEVHPSMHLGADIGRDSSVHRRSPQ